MQDVPWCLVPLAARADRDPRRAAIPPGAVALPMGPVTIPGIPVGLLVSDPGHHGAVTVEQEHPVNGPLGRLIDTWCERRELLPLARLLPAYTSNSGLTDDWAQLMEALYELRSRGRLPATEQAEVERLVPIVERMVYQS